MIILESLTDTSLLYPTGNEEQVKADFEHGQKVLLPWFRENLLNFNTGKYVY